MASHLMSARAADIGTLRELGVRWGTKAELMADAPPVLHDLAAAVMGSAEELARSSRQRPRIAQLVSEALLLAEAAAVDGLLQAEGKKETALWDGLLRDAAEARARQERQSRSVRGVDVVFRGTALDPSTRDAGQDGDESADETGGADGLPPESTE